MAKTLDHDARMRLIALKDIAVAKFTESEWQELGMLTGFYKEVDDHPRLLRSMRFGDPDYEGCALTILSDMVVGYRGDMRNLDVIQKYMAKKFPDTDEGEYVSSTPVAGRRITFAPDVFKVPAEGVDENLVSIMMPFKPEFDGVHTAIKGAVAHAGMTCKRADDIWEHSTVIQDIFSLIFQSYIVVCDFTDRNANVFYEAGIAHTLGKHVIPITQSKADIPFDLQHHRHIIYLNNGEGCLKLREDLAKRLSTLAAKRGSPWWESSS